MLDKQGIKPQIPAGRRLKQSQGFPICIEHSAAALLFATSTVINVRQAQWLDCGCELSQAIHTILKGEIKAGGKYQCY